MDNIPVPNGFHELLQTSTETVTHPDDIIESENKSKSSQSRKDTSLEIEGVVPAASENL